MLNQNLDDTVRMLGQMKRTTIHAVIDIDAHIVEAAARGSLRLDDVGYLYDTWAANRGIKITSRPQQVSKRRASWKFGNRFGMAGVQWIQSYEGYGANLHSAMIKCIKEGCLS
jgi:hypothetical protein